MASAGTRHAITVVNTRFGSWVETSWRLQAIGGLPWDDPYQGV